MIRLGIEGTVRASFGLYNTKEEVEALAAGIERVSKMFWYLAGYGAFDSSVTDFMDYTDEFLSVFSV